MLRHLKVINLNNKINKEINFDKEINIITGQNGSGKTTLLKLIWYLISANIERIPREMTFDAVQLETDKFSVKIEKKRSSKTNNNLYEIIYNYDSHRNTGTINWDEITTEPSLIRDANHRISQLGSSIFFSTFRRIEGGFATTRLSQNSLSSTSEILRNSLHNYYYQRGLTSVDLQNPLERLSDLMSIGDHKFVTSISTNDIVELLTRRYADISQIINQHHTKLTNDIFTRVNKYSDAGEMSVDEKLNYAANTLQAIASQANDFNVSKDKLLSPFTVLSNLVKDVFRHDGIQITKNIILGNTNKTISSDMLSSGEKQLLSFLCYNAFANESVIFIDEPELSLHVDWQRQLFTVLLSQRSTNQFVVTTHSPFIYSKFPANEIQL